jgi:hypothetical protein
MQTASLTIRPPKSCIHAYYALDPAIHTARTKWKQVYNIHVNLAKKLVAQISSINFIQLRLFDCLYQFLSKLQSLTKCNQVTRFAISIILSMHYLQCARLAKSIAGNLFSYINFIQFRHSDCLHQDSRSWLSATRGPGLQFPCQCIFYHMFALVNQLQSI